MSDRTAHLLAKMTARGIKITGDGWVGGGVEVSASDVAAALAGLSRGPYKLILAKYCEDTRAAYELWAVLGLYVRRVSAQLSWRASAEQCESLAFLSLASTVFAIQCPECEGRGVLWLPGGGVEDCERCEGRGEGDIDEDQAIELLNITPGQYQSLWKRRVSIFRSIVAEWEQRALAHLMLRSGGEGIAN